MVPKIWNATDRIFRHFGLFFPFYSPVDPENQNFEKMKKKKKKKTNNPGDIIILQKCTIKCTYGS